MQGNPELQEILNSLVKQALTPQTVDIFPISETPEIVEEKKKEKEKMKEKVKKPRKKPVPKSLRDKIWEKHFGTSMEGVCLCGGILSYNKNYECGHIISEANQGLTIETNLHPVCRTCNRSMGTKNMNEFFASFTPVENKTVEKEKKTAKPIEEKKTVKKKKPLETKTAAKPSKTKGVKGAKATTKTITTTTTTTTTSAKSTGKKPKTVVKKITIVSKMEKGD